MALDDGETCGRTGTMIGYYEVAGFVFSLAFDDRHDLDAMLPSFVDFKREDASEGPLLFELRERSLPEICPEYVLLDDDRNDMGHTRLYALDGGYRVELSYAGEDYVHILETNADFTEADACIRWDDAYASSALASLIRIVCSQAVILHDAVSMHASVVVCDDRAFVFMGRSGTGKSTHSALWLDRFEGTYLLNDDNPFVRIRDGKVLAYGSPWSGKTPCYRAENAPVAGIVRLEQASENAFGLAEDIEAFSVLLPGCSVIRQNGKAYDALCATLIKITELVKVGRLKCLPERGAAELCRMNLI